MDLGGGPGGGLADGAAQVGLLLLDKYGGGGKQGDADAAAFVTAAAAAVAVLEFDADEGDGVGELFEHGAEAVVNEGAQGPGEGDAAGQGDDVHRRLPKKNVVGSLLAGIFDSSTTKILYLDFTYPKLQRRHLSR